MAINKVVYGTTILVDLSDDTVTADTMLSGTTAHSKSGEIITGTIDFATIYTGNDTPSDAIGSDGDLYLVVK